MEAATDKAFLKNCTANHQPCWTKDLFDLAHFLTRLGGLQNRCQHAACLGHLHNTIELWPPTPQIIDIFCSKICHGILPNFSRCTSFQLEISWNEKQIPGASFLLSCFLSFIKMSLGFLRLYDEAVPIGNFPPSTMGELTYVNMHIEGKTYFIYILCINFTSVIWKMPFHLLLGYSSICL